MKPRMHTLWNNTFRFQWVFERFVPPHAFARVDSDAAPQSGMFRGASLMHNSLKIMTMTKHR